MHIYFINEYSVCTCVINIRISKSTNICHVVGYEFIMMIFAWEDLEQAKY